MFVAIRFVILILSQIGLSKKYGLAEIIMSSSFFCLKYQSFSFDIFLFLLAIAQPGIDQRINDICDQADRQHKRRAQKDDCLQHWEIASRYGLHCQSSDAGPGEDLFRHDRAAEQIAELYAHDCENGGQRILERMLPDDQTLRQAFRSAQFNGLRRKDLDHGGTCDAHDR